MPGTVVQIKIQNREVLSKSTFLFVFYDMKFARNNSSIVTLHLCLVFNELSLFWFPKAIHTYVNMRLWQDGKQRNEARYKTLINLLM